MKLELGKTYSVSVRLCNASVITSDLKLIKVTRTGYNFLNVKTNKCVFKSHFYPLKKTSKHYKGEMDFYIVKNYITIRG
jgi:hypothetical protein